VRPVRFRSSSCIDLEPGVIHDRTVLGKAHEELSSLREITQRNKKREISITMSGRAKHGVKLPLHVFPNAETPWANDHAATHIGRLGQFRRPNDLLIPLREILFPSRRDGGFFSFCHNFEWY